MQYRVSEVGTNFPTLHVNIYYQTPSSLHQHVNGSSPLRGKHFEGKEGCKGNLYYSG